MKSLKFILLSLLLAYPAFAQNVSVAGPAWEMQLAGPASQGSILTLLDAQGNPLQMPYTYRGKKFNTDAAFVFNGNTFYCGLPFAQALLIYCQKTNQ